MKSFAGNLISIIDYTRDDNKVLFHVSGDRNPGAYYVLDRSSNKVQLINQAMPWIKPAALAPTTPVSFTTRDGLVLHGFYTGPATQGPKPLIVMPDGGPHGPFRVDYPHRDPQCATLNVSSTRAADRSMKVTRIPIPEMPA